MSPPSEGESARDISIWRVFIENAKSTQGPYSAPSKTKAALDLSERAYSLYGNGPPKETDNWGTLNNSTYETHLQFLSDLISRTIPTPISSRWYFLLVRRTLHMGSYKNSTRMFATNNT